MTTEKPARGRPRRPEIDAALQRATRQVLVRDGYDGLTIEAVARLAGVSKPAVYRRAGSKAELVATALRTTLEATNPHIPDSGNVADDLRVVLDNLVATLTTTDFGRAVVELIGPASREPHLTELIDEVLDQRRIVMRTIIARADGATSRGRDLESAIDMALGAVYFRYLVSRRPLDRDFVDAIVHTFVDEPSETTSL